jgi:hypothetical protein
MNLKVELALGSLPTAEEIPPTPMPLSKMTAALATETIGRNNNRSERIPE